MSDTSVTSAQCEPRSVRFPGFGAESAQPVEGGVVPQCAPESVRFPERGGATATQPAGKRADTVVN